MEVEVRGVITEFAFLRSLPVAQNAQIFTLRESQHCRRTMKKPDAFQHRVFEFHHWREARLREPQASDQWNCSSSVEPVRAFTEDEPPWITVVTSSK